MFDMFVGKYVGERRPSLRSHKEVNWLITQSTNDDNTLLVRYNRFPEFRTMFEATIFNPEAALFEYGPESIILTKYLYQHRYCTFKYFSMEILDENLPTISIDFTILEGFLSKRGWII